MNPSAPTVPQSCQSAVFDHCRKRQTREVHSESLKSVSNFEASSPRLCFLTEGDVAEAWVTCKASFLASDQMFSPFIQWNLMLTW